MSTAGQQPTSGESHGHSIESDMDIQSKYSSTSQQISDRSETSAYEYIDDDTEYSYSTKSCMEHSEKNIPDARHYELDNLSVLVPPPEKSSREVSDLSIITDGGYRMWEMPKVQQMMQTSIDRIASLICIHPSAAQVLLRNFNWDEDKLIAEYFGKEDFVLSKFGVFARCAGSSTHREPLEGSNTNEKRGTCFICFEVSIEPKDMYSMSCGHRFCRSCWLEFIQEAMSRGPDCVHTKCPDPKCTEIITETEIKDIASEYLNKFKQYQLCSYVNSNWLMRWCPGPACRCVAIASSVGLSGEGRCDCGMMFCLRCGNPAHSPATCEMLNHWEEKCQDESETTNWILSNTKKCPKCNIRIEKNQGCNHMRCSQCNFEFCWMCMKLWSNQGEQGGHGYNGSCNKFDIVSAQANDWRKGIAQRELDRYIHFYNRFQAHSTGYNFANDQLKAFLSKMEAEDNVNKSTIAHTDYIAFRDALVQLVECRRVLKYTYILGYYMTCNAKKDLFEDHQALLESFTEKLSELSEKQFGEVDYIEVINMTRVVRTYVKNILSHTMG